MDVINNPKNFTPISNQVNKRKSNFPKVLVAILFFVVAITGLVSYTLLQSQPQITKTPAATSDSISCNSEYPYGWLVYYQFTNEQDCQRCANDRNGCLLPKVGTLQKCFDNSGTICQSLGRCISPPCSTPLPICSVVQLDCVNKEYPQLGGSIGPGKTNDNCICNFPTTPTPTPTPTTPVDTPTPTPTTPVNTPTPTPTTPVNTPTPTTPVNTPTPVPVGCGTKGCDNTTNPCRSGLTCVQANDSSNYCSLPEYTNACKENPSVATCCSPPGNTPTPTQIILTSVTPTKPLPTVPQAGGIAKPWLLIPLGIVLLGLFL